MAKKIAKVQRKKNPTVFLYGPGEEAAAISFKEKNPNVVLQRRDETSSPGLSARTGTSVQGPSARTGTSVQGPSARTGTQNPVATTVSGTQNPVATTVSGTQNPAATTVSGTQNPAATTVSGTQNPVATTVSGTQNPVATANLGGVQDQITAMEDKQRAQPTVKKPPLNTRKQETPKKAKVSKVVAKKVESKAPEVEAATAFLKDLPAEEFKLGKKAKVKKRK